jgi:hypothetical protein
VEGELSHRVRHYPTVVACLDDPTFRGGDCGAGGVRAEVLVDFHGGQFRGRDRPLAESDRGPEKVLALDAAVLVVRTRARPSRRSTMYASPL